MNVIDRHDRIKRSSISIEKPVFDLRF